MKANNNVIHRASNYIEYTENVYSNAGIPGDRFIAIKDYDGWHSVNVRTGERYFEFISRLRNGNYVTINRQAVI